jgi:hypothetical protein
VAVGANIYVSVIACTVSPPGGLAQQKAKIQKEFDMTPNMKKPRQGELTGQWVDAKPEGLPGGNHPE